MQLPPGRSLLDLRCVKDTRPAALDCMAKWTVVSPRFFGFAAVICTPVPVPASRLATCALGLIRGSCDVMLSCCVYLLSMTFCVGSS